MPNYRRRRVPGGTYFFTVNLLDRRSGLLVAHIDALREAVRRASALSQQRCRHRSRVRRRWRAAASGVSGSGDTGNM